MKKIITVVIIALLLQVSYFYGIQKAVTADGYIENNSFVLNVDGQLYAWDIE